jgi:NTP pyrophosphatase (non-canonical NTP hydrolase)
MKELNDKIIEWLKKHNIDKLSPDKQYLKIIEEVGELARGLLKNDLEAIKDAIGDIYIALVGYSLQHDIQEVYVKDEDFKRGSHTLSSLKSFLYVLYDKSYNPSFYDFRSKITYIDLIAYNNNLTLKECVDYAYNQVKDRDIKIIEGVAVK